MKLKNKTNLTGLQKKNAYKHALMYSSNHRRLRGKFFCHDFSMYNLSNVCKSNFSAKNLKLSNSLIDAVSYTTLFNKDISILFRMIQSH